MDKLEKYNLPTTREERIKRLEDSCKILKTEFVGLNDIIDKIGQAITPWYITPEVIVRPTIISLWGMTGTGKTSVVRRLIDLLGIADKSIFFDCGEEVNTGTETVGEKIGDIANADGDLSSIEVPKDLVLVFDEFQHARTINEHGEEVDKPNLRSVWNLLDTGILRIDESHYDAIYFCEFLDDFETYAEKHLEVPIENGKLTNRDDVKELIDEIGFFYYGRGVPGVCGKEEDFCYDENEETGKEDPYAPVTLITDRILRTILKKIKGKSRERYTDVTAELRSARTVGELLDFLKSAKKYISAPKEINCNKSLIFILGNLDEAFKVEGETNPDIDADIFYDRTSKVTITDIKNALKERFRAEQIARFGNSIIKYPTLKKTDFEKVIKMETTRLCNNFFQTTGISLELDQSLYDLLYSEGVYPVQGVRPVFTTIGTIFTPLFSDIAIGFKKNAKISIKDPELGYKFDNKTIIIEGEGQKIERKIDLVLGALRKPDSKKTRYINAVHEAGHAIIMSYMTGKIPMSIVSISSNSGGFCLTYDPEKTGEIECRGDIRNSIMISLGGYLAEKLIFPDDNMRLLGSGSDLEEAWESISVAAYDLGFFTPQKYRNYETYRSEIPCGAPDDKVRPEIIKYVKECQTYAENILRENKNLLVDVAIKLGEIGEMSGETFHEFIKKNTTGTLTEERLEIAKEQGSSEYYKKILLDSKI